MGSYGRKMTIGKDFSKTFDGKIKGTRCLGSVELVSENRSVTVCCKMYVVRKIL